MKRSLAPTSRRAFQSSVCVVMVVSLVGARDASATPVTITNPGFENPALGLLGYSEFGVTGTTPTGWDFSGNPANNVSGRRAGHVNHNVAPLTPGDEVAWLQNGGNFRQVLSNTLQAGVYTLTVQVADLTVTAFPGYNVQLLAGATIVGQDNNSLAPVSQFLTSTVIVDIPFGHPNLGQPLSIRIASLPNPGEAEFNNVALDFVPNTIPEPSSIVLLGGLLAAAGFRKAIRRAD